MKILTVAGSLSQVVALSHLSQQIRRQHDEIFVFCPGTDDIPARATLWEVEHAPQPRYQWAVRSDSPARRCAELLLRLEWVVRRERPDVVLVHGGTDAAMAGALVAAQLHFASAHLEAGLRFPHVSPGDDLNRRLADRLASFRFCVADGEAQRLEREGIREGVYAVGDPVFEGLPAWRDLGGGEALLSQLGLEPGGYYLAAVSLPERDVGTAKLAALLGALGRLSLPAVLVLHPRAAVVMHQATLSPPEGVTVLDPLDYPEMLALEAGAKAIVSDSSAVQREAAFLGVACVVPGEPAWPAAAEAGFLTGAQPEPGAIAAALKDAAPKAGDPPFGDGRACERIVEILSSAPSTAPPEA